MRHAMLALFGLLSASAATMAGAGSAAAFDYPYCIQGRDWGIPGDCSYPSYQACMVPPPGATPIAISIRASRFGNPGRSRTGVAGSIRTTITTIKFVCGLIG